MKFNLALTFGLPRTRSRTRNTGNAIMYRAVQNLFETAMESRAQNLFLPPSPNVFQTDNRQDSPAWVVSRAQQYAIDHGMTPFCIYQGQWNLTKRSFERDIIPMARELGLSP